MPNDPFDSPDAGGAKVTDYEGCLLLLTPTEYKTGIQTTYGEKDAVATDLVALDETESGDIEEHGDMLLFQGVLIGQTKGKVGRGMVLGRLGKRPPSKPGQNPAWVLLDPTEEDKVTAREYLAKKDPFAA